MGGAKFLQESLVRSRQVVRFEGEGQGEIPRQRKFISGDMGSIELGVLGGKVKLVLGEGLASRVLRWKRSR